MIKKDSTPSDRSLLLVLCGPTAIGKTELSLRIAGQFSCEIISVDSMQVYRYMDIGTAKPSTEERDRIPHHLIDIVDPDENYTLGNFIRDAESAIRTIIAHDKIPLLTGGTGLYFKGLLNGVFDEDSHEISAAHDQMGKKAVKEELRRRLTREGSKTLHMELAAIDPSSARRIHPNDVQRILRGLEIYYVTGIPWSEHLATQDIKKCRYQVLKIGLTRPRKKLYARIDQRVGHMAEQGLLAEVRKLLEMGYDKNLKSMQSIGYRHMINFIDGKWSWDETLEFLARDTRHYAKRQYTWFNKDPDIFWHDIDKPENILQEINGFLIKNTS